MLLISLWMLGCTTPQAQSSDQTWATWQNKRISNGLIWRKKKFSSLAGTRQTVNLLEVHSELNQKIIPWHSKGCVKTSEIAKKQNAVAGINGGFFRSDCSSIDMVKIKGHLISPNQMTANPQPTFGVFLIPNSAVTTFKIDDIAAQKDWSKAYHALGGYPNLVTDSMIDIHPKKDSPFFNDRHPRTALGILDDNTVYLVTLDGRTRAGSGVSIEDLAEFLLGLGVKDAINLDGGGSTTMWIRGEGVVNSPSDNRRDDPGGERGVANGLLVF